MKRKSGMDKNRKDTSERERKKFNYLNFLYAQLLLLLLLTLFEGGYFKIYSALKLCMQWETFQFMISNLIMIVYINSGVPGAKAEPWVKNKVINKIPKCMLHHLVESYKSHEPRSRSNFSSIILLRTPLKIPPLRSN